MILTTIWALWSVSFALAVIYGWKTRNRTK